MYVSINRGNAAVTKVAVAAVVVTSCRSEIIFSPAFPSLSAKLKRNLLRNFARRKSCEEVSSSNYLFSFSSIIC